MNPDLSTAFIVLIVGMITVFVILGLVVLTGNVLIKVVNRYYPVALQAQEPKPTSLVAVPKQRTNQSKLAAIVAAVDITSGGRAKIEKIEKIHTD